MFDEYDKFAKLRAIDSGQATASTVQNVRFWSYEKDSNLMELLLNLIALRIHRSVNSTRNSPHRI